MGITVGATSVAMLWRQGTATEVAPTVSFFTTPFALSLSKGFLSRHVPGRLFV
jgi:hypothetical protein